MNKVFVVCCGMLFSMNCLADLSPCNSYNPNFDGTWQGVANQDNGETWAVTVTLKQQTNVYSINYPTLKCGGILTISKDYEDNVIFKEELTSGVSNCHNGTKVTLSLNKDDTLRYQWYYKDGGRKGAVAMLIRQQTVSSK